MSHALILLLAMLALTLLLRMPLGFGMLISGDSYLVFKPQDLGLAAEQVLNGPSTSLLLRAVPLFIVAAAVRNRGTVVNRRVELPAPPLCPDGKAFLARKRFFVWTLAAQCVEDVGNRCDPSLKRNIFSGQS